MEKNHREVDVPKENMVFDADVGYNLYWIVSEPLEIVSRFVYDV